MRKEHEQEHRQVLHWLGSGGLDQLSRNYVEELGMDWKAVMGGKDGDWDDMYSVVSHDIFVHHSGYNNQK